MSNGLKKVTVKKVDSQKVNLTLPRRSVDAARQVKKPPRPAPQSTGWIKDEFISPKEAALAIQQIRLSAQRELELIQKSRADALRYQQELATKARSEAHQIILHARLETQKEIDELIRQAGEELQKAVVDIRTIRVTGQEEFAAFRKFTDAAKLCSMSLSLKEGMEKPERKKKKPLVAAKS